MRNRRRSATPNHRRAGLAPLELVASLPLLLLVMALMIIFGTVGSWKIRALANSRQAIFRATEARTGQNDPHPNGWPTSAQMRRQDAASVTVGFDPFAAHPVVRGPILTGNGEMMPVETSIINYESGSVEGFTEIDRAWPLLKRMRPGRLHFAVHQVLLDGTRWQFWSTRLAANVTRRIPTLYNFLLELRAPREAQAYVEAALAILFNPRRPDLVPIHGGDPEIMELLGIRTPPAYPRPGNACTLDPGSVRTNNVERVIRGVDRLPRNLADRYIGYYQQKIDQLRAQQPPPPGVDQMIAQLQDKIDQLNRFKGSLPQTLP